MKTFATFLILTTLGGFAHAESATELDLTPMIEHFRKQVHVINRPFKTFNWAPRTKIDGVTKADVETPIEKIRQFTKAFWANYGSPSGEMNMYGTGLYSALDPVATQSYGGGADWRLIEMKMPVGARILDFENRTPVDTSDAKLVAAVTAIEQHYECPVSMTAEPYFKVGGAKLARRCTQLIYTVFDQALHVDAIAYMYQATGFRACGLQDKGLRAFVTIRPEWITSENVRVYTRDDLRDVSARILIQSLFLKTVEMGAVVSWISMGRDSANDTFRQILLDHFEKFPDRDLDKTLVTCAGDWCTIKARFCDKTGGCDHVSLPTLPRPGGALITEREASRATLLWPDLIGQRKATNIIEWLKTNKFGCDGQMPYPTGESK